MKQIQFFYGKQLSELQEQVNNFLTTKKYDEVIDIQIIRKGDSEAIIMIVYRDVETARKKHAV